MSDIMVEVYRGDLVESIHRGDIAVVDSAGRLVAGLGDPEKLTYWRSSAKPIQVLPLVECGAADRFGFTDAEIAVMCASHNGEDFHLATVRSILGKIGLGESALKCGTHLPYHDPSARALLASGGKPVEVHCNCSGKHAGMLALAVHMGFPVEDYWKPGHPVQRTLLEAVARMAGMEPASIVLGVDGCGVPVHGLPLSHMALAYARLASGFALSAERSRACRRIVRAMQAHPEMIGGTGRVCTAILTAGQGLLAAKAGAEGVYCVGHVLAGYGIAVKVEDGNGRAAGPAVLEALRQMGGLPKSALLEPFVQPIVTNNRNEQVGFLRAAFNLKFTQTLPQASGAH